MTVVLLDDNPIMHPACSGQKGHRQIQRSLGQPPAASRFYYAAYHAAIAAILHRYSGGRRHEEWDHRVVGRWFADVARGTDGPSALSDLLALRHRADYIPFSAGKGVSLADARGLGRRAHRLYDWVRQEISA